MMRLNKIRCHSLVIFINFFPFQCFNRTTSTTLSRRGCPEPFGCAQDKLRRRVARKSKNPISSRFLTKGEREGDLTNLGREIFLCALRVPFENTRARGPSVTHSTTP